MERIKILFGKIKEKKWAIIFFVALFATNLVTYFYLKCPNKNCQTFQNPYPLIDVSRNLIPQEHFVVNLQPLREDLRLLVKENDNYTTAIYLEFLNTGANIAINTDLGVWPASLAKVPLAMAVMKKVESETWTLDNELVLLEQDKDRNSGTLFNNSVGSRFTIEQLLVELLGNSDNTAYHILLRNMNSSDLQPIVDELGLEALFQPDGKVSAKEYSRIFRSLYTSSFLKRENSQKLLEWLVDSSFKEFLSAGLPKEAMFAHKWGENERFRVWADSGILYVPFRPYILTVMIQQKEVATGDRGSEVRALMKEISRRSYEYLKNY